MCAEPAFYEETEHPGKFNQIKTQYGGIHLYAQHWVVGWLRHCVSALL